MSFLHIVFGCLISGNTFLQNIWWLCLSVSFSVNTFSVASSVNQRTAFTFFEAFVILYIFITYPFESQVSFTGICTKKLRLEQIVHWTVKVFSLRYQLRPTKTIFHEILLLKLQQDLARNEHL